MKVNREKDVDIFDLSYLVLQDGCAVPSTPSKRLIEHLQPFIA